MWRAVDRRTVLRGAFAGGAVMVGLPVLDCMLNANGTALASGAPLPPVFGTWLQKLGLNPGMWEPKVAGANYEHNIQLKVWESFRNRTNVYSGLRYFLDGRPLDTHTTGVQIAYTGAIPDGTGGGPSLDSKIADVIGRRTRFRSLEVALDGSRSSASQRSGTSPNRAEPSPAAMYQRVFGDQFVDPNAAEFTPDPAVMARQSVLSAVGEQRKFVMESLGATDRVRLDEYFSSIRQIEHQLAIELEKPQPLAGCKVPTTPAENTPGSILDDAAKNSQLFAGLLGYAMACGQTQVFNIDVGSNGLRKAGSAYTWHMATHEESVDEHLGYQKDVFEFNTWANQTFANFVRSLEQIREGDGTLMDRTLILWQTDHGDARVHSITEVPVFTVGSGGGRLKTGIHVALSGDPATRVGLTVQQALGVPIRMWGGQSNETTRTITEVIA
jgi:hypothetical protein